MRLSAETERLDALNVLAADARELVLELQTKRPLAKPKSRSQKKAMRQERANAQESIRYQLTAEGRRAFRGLVALELRLEMPPGPHRAGLPRVVKDYLDVLKGLVLPDDAVVEHLLVLHTNAPEGRPFTSRIRCLPLSVFVSEFDRSFRLIDELGEDPDDIPRRDRPWGLGRFDSDDEELLRYDEGVVALIDEIDADEAAQLKEDADADVDLQLSESFREFEDPDARAGVRRDLLDSISRARARWFCDQGFDVRDRPGPPPVWLNEVAWQSSAEVAALDDAGPGCFVLPPPPTNRTPPGQRSWENLIAGEFFARRMSGWWNLDFRGPLALDIAIRGDAAPNSDIDNVAHRVLGSFVEAFNLEASLIGGYRVYRKAGPAKDIRVRVLPLVRLSLLTDSMTNARELVRSERSSRARST